MAEFIVQHGRSPDRLALTHAHGDHLLGSAAFRGAEVIAHMTTDSLVLWAWHPGADHCYCDTMRYSQWLNLAGFPGVSVPIALSSEGLPIGVQIIGRPYDDELVLAVGEILEAARGHWQNPQL